MDRLIAESEKEALTGEQVEAISGCKVVVHSELKGSIFDYFDENNAFVLLYETISKDAGHWVSVLYYPEYNEIEFFDSYGMAPDDELFYSHYDIKPLLVPLLHQSGCRIVWNTRKLQQMKHSINTCGRHAAMRVRLRNYRLQEYIKIITDSKVGPPDVLVSYLTFLY